MKDKIFISHSSEDLHYVKSFVDNVLILGLDISSNRIFCSSLEGHGIRSGEYVPNVLRKEINDSSLALLFISKNYKSSEVCQNEVGAAWAVLPTENIVPLLLPDINFEEVGFLNITKLGLNVIEKKGVLKFIDDFKHLLNQNINFEKLHNKIETYLKEVQKGNVRNEAIDNKDPYMKVDEWTDCFKNNLYPFNEIIRKAIPANDDGVHKILEQKIQIQIFNDLSKAKFLKKFWYKFAKGDYYVEQIKRIPSGNWLVSGFNWEIKIAEMWVSMNPELQYEFVLIKSEELDPFVIGSDVGGESYNVGVLNDGTIVSENERLNGYAIIKGEVIALNEYAVESRARQKSAHWVFFVSDYHKAGFNAEETIKFCDKLDSGEIVVNEENILNFLRKLKNNPIVSRYR